MTTTFQKRQKEHKRQEKQKAKAEVRRNKAIARREQGPSGGAPVDSDYDPTIDYTPITDPIRDDIENPT